MRHVPLSALVLGAVLCLAAAGLSPVVASADTTTTEGSTTTTFCVGPSTDQLILSKFIVAAGQQITIAGEEIDDGTTQVSGECARPFLYTGPISLYLSAGYLNPGRPGTVRLGIAQATHGAFSATITVPTSTAIRGVAYIGYASPDHDIVQTKIAALDPVPVTTAPKPVAVQPTFTG